MNSMTKEQLAQFAEINGLTMDQAEALVIREFKRAEYNAKPEVKAKRVEYRKTYNQRPSVKAKRQTAYQLAKALREFSKNPVAEEVDEALEE